MCLYVIVAIGYPSPNSMSRMAEDLVGLNVLDHFLKNGVLPGFVKNLVNGCFEYAAIFLFIRPWV